MKGQSSLELMVTVAIVLAFTVPVLFLLLSITSVGYEDTSKAQADASARTLADAMNMVYAQGSGAQRGIMLNVPASTEEVSVQAAQPDGKAGEVVVRIRTSAGIFEAVAPTIASVKDTKIQKSGLFLVVVKNNKGKVEIDESPAS
jgi:uncharacterized protein (UPF0333 family)